MPLQTAAHHGFPSDLPTPPKAGKYVFPIEKYEKRFGGLGSSATPLLRERSKSAVFYDKTFRACMGSRGVGPS